MNESTHLTPEEAGEELRRRWEKDKQEPQEVIRLEMKRLIQNAIEKITRLIFEDKKAEITTVLVSLISELNSKVDELIKVGEEKGISESPYFTVIFTETILGMTATPHIPGVKVPVEVKTYMTTVYSIIKPKVEKYLK